MKKKFILCFTLKQTTKKNIKEIIMTNLVIEIEWASKDRVLACLAILDVLLLWLHCVIWVNVRLDIGTRLCIIF